MGSTADELVTEREVGFANLILLPVTYNNGAPVEKELFDALTRQLTIKFGGFTCMPESFGEWVDRHGRFQPDKHRPILVEVPEGREQELEAWARGAGKELDQRVILLLRNFCEASFVEVDVY